MPPVRKDVVAALVATGKWSEETAWLGEEASYRCEYCHHDLLSSADSYKLWQVDHIVPTSKGGQDDRSNKAIACKPCNWDFKSHWDPRTVAGTGATREELLEAVRVYVRERRERTEEEVSAVRRIINPENQDV